MRFLKSLTTKILKSGGRNNRGRITVRHRGGGSKRLYRKIDFKRKLLGISGRIIRIESDSFRTAKIALVYYSCGFFAYIISPEGAKIGDVIKSGTHVWYPLQAQQDDLRRGIFYVDIRKGGAALPLKSIPLGSHIYNVESNWIKSNKGGTIARAAGCSARLITRDFFQDSADDGYALIKLPSGKQKYVSLSCFATVGMVSNKMWRSVSLKKAGCMRGRGRRPHVRGVAMNPVDHPHGGGEGKSSGGRKSSVTPWGKLTKGGRTRKPYKNKRENIFLKRVKKSIRYSRVNK